MAHFRPRIHSIRGTLLTPHQHLVSVTVLTFYDARWFKDLRTKVAFSSTRSSGLFLIRLSDSIGIKAVIIAVLRFFDLVAKIARECFEKYKLLSAKAPIRVGSNNPSKGPNLTKCSFLVSSQY